MQQSYVAKTILRQTTTKAQLIQVMNSEKVSVIIPAFNAADTLAETVSSVLNGTHKHLEILIVDDCSTDATAKVAAKLVEQDSKIQYFRNPQNYGVSKSRNLMMYRATGEYVAFLDSDDTWEPNKLEVCLKMLRQSRSQSCGSRFAVFGQARQQVELHSHLSYNKSRNAGA